MNLLPEVIVIIMSVVVVLSLVHLSVLSFRFVGRHSDCMHRE